MFARKQRTPGGLPSGSPFENFLAKFVPAVAISSSLGLMGAAGGVAGGVAAGAMGGGLQKRLPSVGEGGGDPGKKAQEEYLRKLRMQQQAASGGGWGNPWSNDPYGMYRLKQRYF